MRALRLTAAAAVLAVISGVPSSRGDSALVGNLADSAYGADAVDSANPRAQGFETGGRDWRLTSIQVDAGGLAAGAAFAGEALLVGSTTNGQGEDVPDLAAPLTTLLFPTVGEDFATLSLTPTSIVVLRANTEYWLVLQTASPNDASFSWRYTYDTTVDPGSEGGLTSAAAILPPGSGEWRSQPNAPYLIQVRGVPLAVPEPSAWLLCGPGLAASVLAAVGRSRRSQPARRGEV